ncbi:MAG: ABC transporter substrate-binding protein [Acidimicrobiaceae bacterium]|nr:ABC transporter substrate-binding protein [Acidimicrobiaceae bacterium]
MKTKILGLTLVSALVISACGSSGSASSTATTAGSSSATTSAVAKASTATQLSFNADGTPNLKGLTFAIGNAAGSAHIGDTNVYNLVQMLKKWGAKASQTNASGNAAELAVASGSLNATTGPLPTEVDAGLIVFGPNQARLDDVLLAKTSVATLSDLKGKKVAICCDASPDGVLLSAALSKGNLTSSQVTLLKTGASSASLNALIAGQVDAAFVHSNAVPKAGSKFHVLAVGATLLPQYADSFMAAEASWLKANPAMAEAIDLAWLASAKLFNTDEASWVTAASAYTKAADTTAQYQAAWTELQSIQGWPTDQSIVSSSVVSFNLGIAKQQNALKGPGLNPAAQLIDLTPWQSAWTQFSAHESAY